MENILISKNWDCIKTFDELLNDAKFIFVGNGNDFLLPRIVLNTPINEINCIQIDYDRYGLINGAECIFNHEWGKLITDSSINCKEFIIKFLEHEGCIDLLIKTNP